MKNLCLLMSSHHHLLPNKQSPLHCMVFLLQDHLHHHLLIFLQQGREQEGNRNKDDQYQKASVENQRYLWNKALLLHLELVVEMDVLEEVEMAIVDRMEMEEEVKKAQVDLLEELEALEV